MDGAARLLRRRQTKVPRYVSRCVIKKILQIALLASAVFGLRCICCDKHEFHPNENVWKKRFRLRNVETTCWLLALQLPLQQGDLDTGGRDVESGHAGSLICIACVAGFVFGGDVLRVFHGDECLTIPPREADNVHK